MLTTFDADEHVLRALRAGAGGFLLKDTPPAEIVQAVRRVAAGEAMLSPTVTRQLIDARDRRRLRPAAGTRAGSGRCGCWPGSASGSGRWRSPLGQGRTNAEIAAELFMSVATVKAHVSRLLTRLDLNNRVQVALLVHDAGLV